MSERVLRPPAGPAQPLAHEVQRRRKRRDAAFVMPLAGAFLLASPLLDAVADAGLLFGIPAGLIYIFAIWFGLIAGTALLARRLGEGNGSG